MDKILLINFTQAEADKLKELPFSFELGYIGDQITAHTTMSQFSIALEDEKNSVSDIDYYFKYPIYEHKAVFINLSKSPSLEKEFKILVKKYTIEEKKDFFKYWALKKNPIIFFLGDTSFNDLTDFGIPEITLKKVRNNDQSLNTPKENSRTSSLDSFFAKNRSQVSVPTSNYIVSKREGIYSSDNNFLLQDIYWNNNNEDVGIYIEDNQGYSSTDRPLVLLLPEFKNKSEIVKGLLYELADLYPKHFPNLPKKDWINDDSFFPNEVLNYDKEIDTIISNAKEKIEELNNKKEATKAHYKNLKGILYQTGDNLKNSILNVLVDIFKIEAIDGDMERTGSIQNEDLIISFNGEKVLCEVKGVKAQNPTPLHITQLWKHISRSKFEGTVKGMLIINHDLETQPDKRSEAYKGEAEEALNDIIFIDTRVMFNLAIAVIDYKMDVQEAQRVLFQNGRVQFNLKDYIKNKETREKETKDLIKHNK